MYVIGYFVGIEASNLSTVPAMTAHYGTITVHYGTIIVVIIRRIAAIQAYI